MVELPTYPISENFSAGQDQIYENSNRMRYIGEYGALFFYALNLAQRAGI